MSFSPSVLSIKNDVYNADESVYDVDMIVKPTVVMIMEAVVDTIAEAVVKTDLSIHDDLIYKEYIRKLSQDKQDKIKWKRDNYFFKKLPLDISCNIQMDETASYSVTEMNLANETSIFILQQIFEQGLATITDATITDATACIGGNTFSFSKYFAHVNSVEIDPMRAEFLRNNLKLLCPTNNVEVFVGDYIDIQNSLKQDVVFIDPPWGSKYFEKKKLSLFLSNKPLVKVCCDLRGQTSLIVIKVPWNFDFKTFQKKGCKRGVLSNFDKKELGKGRIINGRQMPKFVILSMQVT